MLHVLREHGVSIAPPAVANAMAGAAGSGLDFGGGTLDDFIVEKAIGRGHFSVVHRAIRKSDEIKVALKKVSIFDTMDAKSRDRCLKEVKLLQTLPPHPCIIRYIDAFIDSNELYIVFEWAEHGDLRRLLKRAQEANTSLQEPQIWRYFVQISDAIRHMHDARVMHRDIKPANIFLATYHWHGSDAPELHASCASRPRARARRLWAPEEGLRRLGPTAPPCSSPRGAARHASRQFPLRVAACRTCTEVE